MKVDVLTLGAVSTNCYIISEGSSCIIIDPADRADRIIDHLQKNELTCNAIFLTHGHFDHISAVDELCKKLDVSFYIHEDDVIMLENPIFNASGLFGFDKKVTTPPLVFYGNYTKHFIHCFEIEAISTPGHSKGSVCYKIGNNIFCGDLLFYTSCGRTDLYGASSRELISSISEIVKNNPDDTVIYPGHDRHFTIKEAKENNYIVSHYVLGQG